MSDVTRKLWTRDSSAVMTPRLGLSVASVPGVAVAAGCAEAAAGVLTRSQVASKLRTRATRESPYRSLHAELSQDGVHSAQIAACGIPPPCKS